jgi:hypothetical protein
MAALYAMRVMRARNCLAGLCVAVAVACGGERSHTPDAGKTPDAPPDTLPSGCSYAEKADASNDPAGDTASHPMAELTRLEVGTEPRTLCGKIDTGHFNSDSSTIDADAYRVTTNSGDLIVRFAHAAPAGIEFSVFVFDTAQNPTLLFGGSSNAIIGDHGVFVGSLPAGTYDVVVSAHGAADLAAPFDYRVQLAPDPATRCAAITAPAAYTEAADAAGTGNDVISVDFDLDLPFQLTAATDAAEPTGLTIDTTSAIRITGTSANEDAEDDYMDRDTYLVQTGTTTGELTLRLRWADEQTNLDYIVFPADKTDEVGDSLRLDGHEEYNIVAVKPSSAYWIWIGSHDGSTGLPATYDLSICGSASP